MTLRGDIRKMRRGDFSPMAETESLETVWRRNLRAFPESQRAMLEAWGAMQDWDRIEADYRIRWMLRPWPMPRVPRRPWLPRSVWRASR